MSRVLIVSNRLPISVTRGEGGALRVSRSAGGLATGLSGVHAGSGGLWIGWPGISGPLSPEEEASLEARYNELSVVPVALSADEVERFYEQFCNGIIWPGLHYLVGQLPLEIAGYELYEAVNRRFAEAVVAQYRPGDVIWVHDYQLLLVPQMIRDRLPDASIGFFLHIPFPASDVFRILPFREGLLTGMLGADLLGFHTAEYMRHFASSALRTLGIASEVDRIRWEGRSVHIGVFPMGVDAQGHAAKVDSPAVNAQLESIRQNEPEDGRLLVGVDRLDYTKGLPQRLLSYEKLLRQHPELRGKVRLIQVAAPSRANVDRYQEYRDQVNGLVGRINGELGTPSWAPVHYIYRGLPADEVMALYRAADVMLVTPLRDGMNLVAKEFVATRTDEDGVLVLSDFAGAASELAEAVHVNPYDVEGTAEAIHRALVMPHEERQGRMRALRQRVFAYDVTHWAGAFLDRLAATTAERVSTAAHPDAGPTVLPRLVARAQAAERLLLLIDYDGTLVPFARSPELARPDPEALALLRGLAARPGTEVHVVSGRSRSALERWLGALPIFLHAEHGLWSRPPGQPGHALELPPSTWRESVLEILREYAGRTPGSLVEEKPVGAAWHYRGASPEYGEIQANELRLHLTEILSNAPVELLKGEKVIEVRAQGIHKGLVVPGTPAGQPGWLTVAIGDDRTDEDLFGALPPDALTIKVGSGDTRAAFRLSGVPQVRALLRALLAQPSALAGVPERPIESVDREPHHSPPG
jgi:trehalose 6-phosphate synthase/phosphatase